MALVASEVNSMILDLSARLVAGRKRFDQALLQVNAVTADLQAMNQEYRSLFDAIQAEQGGSAAVDGWKDMRTRLLAEATALGNKAQAKKAALESA